LFLWRRCTLFNIWLFTTDQFGYSEFVCIKFKWQWTLCFSYFQDWACYTVQQFLHCA
jgi:hypothetical protein